MKAFKRKRIVVAMSGGVDSSVAAALLKKEGYEVIGISLRLWPKKDCGFYKPGACCSLEGISDARLVSEKLDIPFYVLDFHEEFQKTVIDYFTSEYLNGRTPNPCILCNEKIKFGALLKKTDELKAEYIATGHYARMGYDKKNNVYTLKEGKDSKKDQSYVLFSLTQDQLLRVKMPLGRLKKNHVRKIAKGLRIPVHSKQDSQEICFIKDSCADYLRKNFKDKIRPGPILLKNGRVLGTHKGSPLYTIGQRKGLGISYKHALYVNKIDINKNIVIVGPKEDTYFKDVFIKNLSWIIKPARKTLRATVKIRSQHKKAKATLHLSTNSVRISFDHPQESPTPGQAAVFYNKDLVIGGGWIDHYEDIKN